MVHTRFNRLWVGGCRKGLGAALLGLALSAPARGTTLEGIGHVHGIEAGPAPGELLLGAHDGLYRLTADGVPTRLPGPGHDFMGLSAAPDGTLYASGHPSGGGNLGLLRSTDRGASWERWSDGGKAAADFHQLAVSPSQPAVLYGVFEGLRRSADGGRSWQRIADAPDKLFALAVASGDPATLFAATRAGLLRSTDQGRSWAPAHPAQAPATFVTAADGRVTAFIVGQGLILADETTLEWQVLSNPFGGQVPVDIVRVGGRTVALTHGMKLLESPDGGRTWQPWGGERPPATAAAQRGKALFEANCQACHGYRGMGETLVWDERANTLAPALDDSAHAWHHTDEQLVETILNGLPQGSGRMVAWKEKLSPEQARDIVVYFKSLWGKRALECQGPKHMQCM